MGCLRVHMNEMNVCTKCLLMGVNECSVRAREAVCTCCFCVCVFLRIYCNTSHITHHTFAALYGARTCADGLEGVINPHTATGKYRENRDRNALHACGEISISCVLVSTGILGVIINKCVCCIGILYSYEAYEAHVLCVPQSAFTRTTYYADQRSCFANETIVS